MAVWKDKHLYAVHEVHLDDITTMLNYLVVGNKVECMRTLQKMYWEAKYGSGCITQSLSMDMLIGPQNFGNIFSPDEWSEMIDSIENCSDYYQIIAWIDRYGSKALSKLGGF